MFSDTGDPTKLNELVIKVIDQQSCARQWQPTAILNTHICVGDGETGACSVSKMCCISLNICKYIYHDIADNLFWVGFFYFFGGGGGSYDL